MGRYDVIIIGAGMAGLSAAYALSPSAKVLVVEREDSPGYHSTGRSAAVYGASYGSEKPVVNALTKASADFLLNPPVGFCEHPLHRDRGVLFIAHQSQGDALKAAYQEMQKQNPHMEWMCRQDIELQVPVLKPEYCEHGFYDKDVYDLDVNAMQGGYIRALRQRGSSLLTGFEVRQLNYEDQAWVISDGERAYSAPVVVNAAGAWVDEIAEMAGVQTIGIEPLRRTAILVEAPADTVPDHWPLVVEFEEQFYFKPDAGKVLISSANEDASPPCDVQPEELDIAYAVHYAGEATTLEIKRVDHAWSGLRNFVADRSPVIGFDAASPGFFWLAGQGGYGIQTAPAAGRLVASLILEDEIPSELDGFGLTRSLFPPPRIIEA